MQNEITLIDLGFQKNTEDEWFWRGTHQMFTAKVIDFNGPIEYVELYQVSKQIDNRPYSDRKGRHYQSLLKDCCSDGSVKRALNRYDAPDK